MKLGVKQRLFHRMFFHSFMPRAWEWAKANGIEIVVSETWRDPVTAAANQRKGVGIANSLHCEKLAVDLQLFRDGDYIEDTKEYAPLGLLWESFSTTVGGEVIECCWGGRFNRRDGGHFSLAHDGRK